MVLTTGELEFIRKVCESAHITGVDWALGVSLFPPRNEQERLWKERMLMGIQLVCPQARQRRGSAHAVATAARNASSGVVAQATFHKPPDVAGF